METKQYIKELTSEYHQQRAVIAKAYNKKVDEVVEKFIAENNLQDAIPVIYTTHEPWNCGDHGYDWERMSERKYNWDAYLSQKTCTIAFMPNPGDKYFWYDTARSLPFTLELADNRKPQ